MDEALNTYYEPELLRRHISSIHANNPDMLEFLYPSNALYGWIRHYVGLIEDFGKWDQIPEKFLDHIASNFDFELIGLPYATVAERRKLIRDIIYIYRRKGTKGAIERLVTDLGFGYSWTDPPGLFFPFVTNVSKTWNADDNVILKYTTEFADKVGWTQHNIGSWWRIESGKLVGTGDGTSDTDSVITIANSYGENNKDILMIDFTYEITTLDTNLSSFIGVYIKFDDTTHFWRMGLSISTFVSHFTSQHDEGSGFAGTVFYDLKANLNPNQYETGKHRVRIMLKFGIDSWEVQSITLDELLLDISSSHTSKFPGITWDNKGLAADIGNTVEYENITIQTINKQQSARIFGATTDKRLNALDETIGLWRFKTLDGTDESSFGNNLTNNGFDASDLLDAGITEPGITVLEMNITDDFTIADGTPSEDFEMGMSDFTIEAWVLMKSTITGTDRSPFGKIDAGGGWQFTHNVAYKWGMNIGDGSTIFIASDTAVNDDKFHLITAVVDRTANTVDWYIDGVFEISRDISAITGNVTPTGTSFRIYGQTQDDVIWWDEICVTKRKLTTSEILARYTGVPGTVILNYTLHLTGTPYKSANKIDFLKHILGNYSPFAVDITVVT